MLEGGTLGMVERREHTILKCCRTAVHRTGSPAKRRGSLVVWNRRRRHSRLRSGGRSTPWYLISHYSP
jgi:hypothetical protein